MNQKNRPVVLAIVSGFGVAPPGEGNAVSQAIMPNWKKLISNYPVMTLSQINQEPDILSF